MAVLECVFVMCLRLRVEKWDPHSGCNALSAPFPLPSARPSSTPGLSTPIQVPDDAKVGAVSTRSVSVEFGWSLGVVLESPARPFRWGAACLRRSSDSSYKRSSEVIWGCP